MAEWSPINEGYDTRLPHVSSEVPTGAFMGAEGSEPAPTLITPGSDLAETPDPIEPAAAQTNGLFIENTAWGEAFIVEPEQAASILEPLTAKLFTPRPNRIISWVDTSLNHDYVDPPPGPAVGGLFHEHIAGSFTPDLTAPADFVFAQQSKDTGLITAEWHAIKQLGTPTEVCGDGNCIRLLYNGGNTVEVQDISGEPVEITDERFALTALRWMYTNLDMSGKIYDVSGIVNSTNQLAQQIVGAGHQLTIPDAAAVSRACHFPYPTR